MSKFLTFVILFLSIIVAQASSQEGREAREIKKALLRILEDTERNWNSLPEQKKDLLNTNANLMDLIRGLAAKRLSDGRVQVGSVRSDRTTSEFLA